MSLRPKNGCVAVSILVVYTRSNQNVETHLYYSLPYFFFHFFFSETDFLDNLLILQSYSCIIMSLDTAPIWFSVQVES